MLRHFLPQHFNKIMHKKTGAIAAPVNIYILLLKKDFIILMTVLHSS